MIEKDERIAELLLQSKAIKLQPTNPFTWASGWKSPIYCDNRITLSFPEIRDEIKNHFADLIKKMYPDAELIAGVATGAIAQAALVADTLNLPMVYVRHEKKKHGLGNQVEGSLKKDIKTVVIEDLVSTGRSSLNAVLALKNENADVLGMLAIFTYGFPLAEENFHKSGCRLTTLSNYNTLLKLAIKSGYIIEDQLETLSNWRKDPGNWKV